MSKAPNFDRETEKRSCFPPKIFIDDIGWSKFLELWDVHAVREVTEKYLLECGIEYVLPFDSDLNSAVSRRDSLTNRCINHKVSENQQVELLEVLGDTAELSSNSRHSNISRDNLIQKIREFVRVTSDLNDKIDNRVRKIDMNRLYDERIQIRKEKGLKVSRDSDRSSWDVYLVPEDAIMDHGTLFFHPALNTDVTQAENRLGVSIESELSDFYKKSNGWILNDKYIASLDNISWAVDDPMFKTVYGSKVEEYEWALNEFPFLKDSLKLGITALDGPDLYYNVQEKQVYLLGSGFNYLRLGSFQAAMETFYQEHIVHLCVSRKCSEWIIKKRREHGLN